MATGRFEVPVPLPAATDCARCAMRLHDSLIALDGVTSVDIDPRRRRVSVGYDDTVKGSAHLATQAQQVVDELLDGIDHHSFRLEGLDCPDCARSIEAAVERLPGVLWASASFASGQLHVETESCGRAIPAVIEQVEAHGARACPTDRAPCACCATGDTVPSWRSPKGLATWFAIGLTIVGAALSLVSPKVAAVIWATAVVVGGRHTARAAWTAVRERTADMNLLMTLAVIGAAVIGEWFEAATVVALFGLGNLLEAAAMERTRRSIRGLMDLTPATARVHRDGQSLEVPVDALRIGDVVIVRPGDRVPTDGEVIVGSTAVNEAPVTGESCPVDKVPGDRVFAGTLNGAGAVDVRVTRAYADTVLARTIHLVEQAQAQRAPAQRIVERFARVYTPAVVAGAILVAVVPPVVLGPSPEAWTAWFTKALSLLIIACPCALVIATPVAIVTAIGNASRAGALIKGGVFLEELARVRAVVFDKTGTLTEGRFSVEDVVSFDGAAPDDVLRLAAAVERRSQHPLASAIVAAADATQGHAERLGASEFRALHGLGAQGVVNGRAYLVGNPALLAKQGIALDGSESTVAAAVDGGRTVAILADKARALGMVVLADRARPNAREAVRQLRAQGIARLTMLTGDSTGVARAVADEVGLDGFAAGLLPEQKLDAIHRELSASGAVAMVGDGVNDAPALAAATVGIAMGAAGSDTAIETADIALMGDDLSRLPYLIGLSRRARAIMRQNVAFALVTKAGLVAAAATVGVPLWLAVLGDMGVSLAVICNALRLVRHEAPAA